MSNLTVKSNSSSKTLFRIDAGNNYGISKAEYTLPEVEVPANSGISNTTVDLTDQIPAGMELLMATMAATASNNVYCYYISSKKEGTVTYQLKNVSNSPIKVKPIVCCLLISR